MALASLPVLFALLIHLEIILGQPSNLNNNQNVRMENKLELSKQIRQYHNSFPNAPVANLQQTNPLTTSNNGRHENGKPFNHPTGYQITSTYNNNHQTFPSSSAPISSTIAPAYSPKPAVERAPNSRPRFLQLNIPAPIINKTPAATCVPSPITPSVLDLPRLRNERTISSNYAIPGRVQNTQNLYTQNPPSIILTQPPSTTPQYMTIPAQPVSFITPKMYEGSKSSNIKVLLPLLYELLQEKNTGCGCCRSCNCVNRKSNSIRSPHIYGGYSTLKNYSPIYKEVCPEANEECEELDNFCERLLKRKQKKRRIFKKKYESEEEDDDDHDEDDDANYELDYDYDYDD